jgi:hypothetical protein
MKLWITPILAVACVCVFAQGGLAQDSSPVKKANRMTGCLQAGSSSNVYVLGAREWGGPRVATIVSSDVDLAAYLKHRVEVTGTIVPAKEAEETPNVSKAFHYMHVTAIKTVSASCR